MGLLEPKVKWNKKSICKIMRAFKTFVVLDMLMIMCAVIHQNVQPVDRAS